MLGIGMQHQNDPNGLAWRQNRDFENVLRRLNDGTEATAMATTMATGPFHKARELETGDVGKADDEEEEEENDEDKHDDECGDADARKKKEKEKKKKKKKRKAAETDGVDSTDEKERKKPKKPKSQSTDDRHAVHNSEPSHPPPPPLTDAPVHASGPASAAANARAPYVFRSTVPFRGSH